MLLLLEVIPYLVIFVFGIVIGSFLNVCIYRIPQGQSIVTVPSHCMSCGYRLCWYDLVPLFSWLFLKGRCRKCGAKISAQYPAVEAANGILYVLIFYINGWNGVSICYSLMASALLTLSLIDWRTYEIPWGINVFLGATGAAVTLLDRYGWKNHLIGAVCVSGFLGILYLFSGGRAIGGGDIKLMAACGLILGWQKIILAFVLGCILGSVIHSVRMKLQGAERMLAMGPYLSAGVLLAALWGDVWIGRYMELWNM